MSAPMSRDQLAKELHRVWVHGTGPSIEDNWRAVADHAIRRLTDLSPEVGFVIEERAFAIPLPFDQSFFQALGEWARGELAETPKCGDLHVIPKGATQCQCGLRHATGTPKEEG